MADPIHASTIALASIYQWIAPGNRDSCYAEWSAFGDGLVAQAAVAERVGHAASAASVLVRAAEYYRQAFFWHRDDLDGKEPIPPPLLSMTAMDIPQSLRVAIVDDDTSVCRAFVRLLPAAGIHSIAYNSAEAFLEAVDKPRFDCHLFDIQLGGMSGIDRDRRLAGKKSPAPSQAQSASVTQGQAAFGKARAACLEGRGYSVK